MGGKNINLRELLIPPRHLDAEHSINISTDNDLIFLGRDNLSSIEQYWSEEKRALCRVVEDLELDIALLATGDPDAIREVAEHHEHLAPELLGVLNGMCSTWPGAVVGSCKGQLKIRKAALAAREQRLATYISYLGNLIAKAEPKPPFAPLRASGHYVLGDAVKLLTNINRMPRLKKKNTFVSGTIAMSFSDRVLVSLYDDTKRIWMDVSNPCIMLDREFYYLRRHPKYLKLWLCFSGKDLKGFNEGHFVEALRKKLSD